MTDSLDDLLDRSAPTLTNRGHIRDAALTQMVRDARDTASPVTRPRRRTAALAGALAGLLVLGGGGIAVASGLVQWPAGFEDPDTSFAFTLPSGRACEVRMVVDELSTEAADGEQRAQEEVNRWLPDVNLWSELNLRAAEKEVEAALSGQRANGMTVLIDADGWLADASLATREPTADDMYAFAVNRAVSTAIRDRLTAVGIAENEWTFGVNGGVKCAAE